MNKTLIIILVIVALAVLGFVFLNVSEEADTGLVSTRNVESQVGTELLAALATIDTLRIDTEFFKDPTFRRLVNFSRDIPLQPQGRSNPFAPIGASAAPVSTSTNTQ